MAWSGGKDSALALWEARRRGWPVAGLLTTVTQPYDRISMHGVRTSLLDAQARALGLPCTRVEIPPDCPNDVYEERMGRALVRLREEGVDAVVFGDLFLEDIRAYRERQMEGSGLRPLFPLWGRNTAALAREFLAAGFRAVVVTVDPRQLDPRFAGREYDADFLAELPPGVDPCGERGEFHTFVYAGPIFPAPVPVRRGEVVERGGFVFADLVPE
ncbi:MAG: adenine nucleotide alpha hydrolase [Firmicutes bacterium]|nr:adenine nucleotide alpha hydrolase [Bacillota bacterium]